MYELKTVIRKLFIACFLCLFLISCKDAKLMLLFPCYKNGMAKKYYSPNLRYLL